jgi:hypothetical protein
VPRPLLLFPSPSRAPSSLADVVQFVRRNTIISQQFICWASALQSKSPVSAMDGLVLPPAQWQDERSGGQSSSPSRRPFIWLCLSSSRFLPLAAVLHSSSYKPRVNPQPPAARRRRGFASAAGWRRGRRRSRSPSRRWRWRPGPAAPSGGRGRSRSRRGRATPARPRSPPPLSSTSCMFPAPSASRPLTPFPSVSASCRCSARGFRDRLVRGLRGFLESWQYGDFVQFLPLSKT